MRKKDDLIGKKFNKLTVFGEYYDEEKRLRFWLSKCDCGSEKTVKSRGIELKKGHTKSCSCLKAAKLKFGENAFNRLYDTYRRRSLQKGFPFDLSKEDFKEITSKNCFYCNVEPKQKAPATKNKKTYGYYTYNGIDRIDSLRGYEKENVVPCCGQCNIAKNDYTYEEFFDWVNRIHENFSLKDRNYKKLDNLKT